MPHRNVHRANAAFTLVELAIVLGIIGVLLGGGLSLFADRMAAERLKETTRRLDMLEEALLLYRRTNGVLPCPARGDLLPTNSSFGAENCAAAVTGIDYTGRAGNTASSTCEGSSSFCIRVGVVPTRTLNLPDNFAFDGYGNKITYAVDRECTTGKTWSSSNCGNGQLVIHDSANTSRTGSNPVQTSPVYALVSHGVNMVGAWGGKLTTRIAVAPPGTLYSSAGLENANAHSTGAALTAVDATFRDMLRQETGTATTYFDDLVRWKVKNQL